MKPRQGDSCNRSPPVWRTPVVAYSIKAKIQNISNITLSMFEDWTEYDFIDSYCWDVVFTM